MTSEKMRKIVKNVAKFTIGHSVSFVVVKGVHANVETDDSVLQNAELYVGAAALGVMAAEKADSWVETKVDELFDNFSRNQDETPENVVEMK